MWDQQITDPATGQSAPAATAIVEQLTGPSSVLDISTVHYATDPAALRAAISPAGTRSAGTR